MVECVARGFPCFASRVGPSYRDGAERTVSAGRSVRLTRRECEILVLIEQGLSNKEIAARLVLQPATVKNHVHNLLTKLGVPRRFEAIEWLRRHRRSLSDGRVLSGGLGLDRED